MAESMKGLKRSHRCTEVSNENIGETVTLMGWVQKRRNLGSLIFVDLRDRSGLIQLYFDEETIGEEGFKKAASLRAEFVIAVTGTVEKRSGAVNENLETGDIEVKVDSIRILSESETPPFPIDADITVKDELRLKYRFLDLRRPNIQKNLMMRSKVATLTRQFLANEGFLEIETPMLTRSTPEGARDYLVPSRVHPGSFYALPQSPQLFKQLLMCSGYDRYFQLARCFRDEDLRADRQPEFTQIDMELSFVDVDDVIDVNERLLAYLFKLCLNEEVSLPIQRMTWQDAMDYYGSDKPDLRFDMKIQDVSELVKDCGFGVFTGAIENGGMVRGLCAKGLGDVSSKKMKHIEKTAKDYGAKGLAYIQLKSDGTVKCDVLGALRLKFAEELNLLDKSEYRFVWITEFPLLEWSEEENRYTAMHHPFTMPMEEDLDMIDSEPGKVRAKAYDIVLNGTEIGGGSVRIHQNDIQEKMFECLGISKEQAQEKFGFLLEAFKYGVPPHAGLAYGLDRLVMLMTKEDTIRDVIAFPKVKDASCLLTDAPNTVDDKQLEELCLEIEIPEKE